MQELQEALQLTTEQSFSLEAAKREIPGLSREDLEENVLALLKQVYVYKNIASKILKEQLLGEMGMQ